METKVTMVDVTARGFQWTGKTSRGNSWTKELWVGDGMIGEVNYDAWRGTYGATYIVPQESAADSGYRHQSGFQTEKAAIQYVVSRYNG